MTLKRPALLVAFGLLACAGIARADDAANSAAAEELKTLQRYGATHKRCQGWTDGCALCARRSDGSLGCSRMGVDCDIAAIQCTQLERDPKTGKTPSLEQ